MALATPKKTELKLTGVAPASIEELLLDHEDFLRQRGLRVWPKDRPEALKVRRIFRSNPFCIPTATPEVAANTLLWPINQMSFLLGRQFLEGGGVTERLYQDSGSTAAAIGVLP